MLCKTLRKTGVPHFHPDFRAMKNMPFGVLMFVCSAASLFALPPASVPLDVASVNNASKASNPTHGAERSGQFFTTIDISGPGATLGEWVLVRTDGTANGTVMVTDSDGRPMEVDPFSDATTVYDPAQPSQLVVLGGHIYFRSSTPSAGILTAGELWRTDGTPAGTTLVKDIYTGLLNASNPNSLLATGGVLYFSAFEPATGRELWKSDGTNAGTVMVRDIVAGAGSGNAAPVAGVGSLCYFLHRPSALVAELWVTDGTSAGTRKFSNRAYLGGQEMNGRFIFMASDPGPGDALMSTSGTTAAGVTEVVLATNVATFYPGNNGRVYFVASGGLWSSDGTPGGTAPVAPVSGAFAAPYFGWNGHLHGTDAFAGDGSQYRPARIPLNGGTMTHVSPVLAATFDATRLYHDLGSRLVYWHKPAGGLWTLYGFDGSTTTPLRSFPGSPTMNNHELPGLIRPLGKMGNTLFFAGPVDTAGHLELWKTDGTPGGTALVADLNVSLATRTPIVSGAATDTAWYFLPLADGRVQPVRTSGRPGDQTRFGPLYRVDSAGEIGGKLFAAAPSSSTPAAAASMAVVPVAGGAATFLPGLSSPMILRPLGSRMLFTASPDAEGPELYISDGTSGGTVRLTTFPAFPTSTPYSLQLAPQDTYALGSLVLFRVTTDAAGTEFWKTDGTPAGTTLLKDIRAGTADGIVLPQGSLAVPGLPDSNAVVFGSHLYFRANDGTNGSELWRTDGSSAGTILVSNIRSGSNSSSPDDFAATTSYLYFSANDGINGNELWRSNGTAGGTTLVRDIRAGTSGSFINNLRSLGSSILFTADDGINGSELWKSDGTLAGTTLVKDIRPGAAGCQPNGAWVAGDRYFLIADDGSGPTLWVSDGTTTGTMPVAEGIPPGAIPSQIDAPIDATSSHGSFLLYQTAVNTVGGIERQVRVVRPSYTGPPGWAAWVAANFPPGALPEQAGFAADPDLDGFTNHDEYFFATNPQSAGSRPGATLLPLSGAPPAEFRISVRSDAGPMKVQWSSNLLNWTPAANVSFGGSSWTESSADFSLNGIGSLGGGIWQFNIRPAGGAAGSGKAFFRFGVTPSIP